MPVFKEAEIKKMLDSVKNEQLSFSRMVELMNHKAHNHTYEKTTIPGVIEVLSAFLAQNVPLKHETFFKTQSLVDSLKSELTCNAIDTTNLPF